MAGLIAFRLVWGCIGSRYARFGDFVRGPAAVASYFRALLRGEPQRFLGHNPAGALAILALLACGAATAATGWIAWQETSAEWWEEVHEACANLMLSRPAQVDKGSAFLAPPAFSPPTEGQRTLMATPGIELVAHACRFEGFRYGQPSDAVACAIVQAVALF